MESRELSILEMASIRFGWMPNFLHNSGEVLEVDRA